MSDVIIDDDSPQQQAVLQELAESALAQAGAQGASGAEVSINTESGLMVTVRMGEVDTVQHTRDKALGVTVYFGTSKGSASTTDFSVHSVGETVSAACAIARYTAEDSCAGLADAELMARHPRDLQLSHPWTLSTDEAIELAHRCESVAREADDRVVNSEGATLNTHRGWRVYANTNDFVGGYPFTAHSVSCAVIARDANGMQRDYWYTVARDSADLEDLSSVGRQAAQRAVRRLGARRLVTCKVPVLFSADTARSLLGHFVGAVNGGNLYRQSSFLLDRIGQQVFAGHVHIHEQPHLLKALGSATFDNEGVATAPRDVVRDGILEGYVLNHYSACRLGMQTTANAGGVHNLTLEPGNSDFEDLLRQMHKGLLVTELMGSAVNIVTGDYSRGAAGFWVENGEIQYPVEEITIAGRLTEMFMCLAAVGRDVDTRGNLRTGSILIERMTVAGQ